MRCERCDREVEAHEAWTVELRKPADGCEADRLRLCEKCAGTVFNNAANAAYRVRDRKKGVVG